MDFVPRVKRGSNAKQPKIADPKVLKAAFEVVFAGRIKKKAKAAEA